MNAHPNITIDPAVMGGKPCIRGMRVTVGMILGLMAKGHATDRIADFPYLTEQDLKDALAYAESVRRPCVVAIVGVGAYGKPCRILVHPFASLRATYPRPTVRRVE